MNARSIRHGAGALRGRHIVITRPSGTGAAFARQVRAAGGVPLSLPGLALRAAEDVVAARRALRDALRADLLVFTSPAAVRHAAGLAPLRTRAAVYAVGAGTTQALRRHGLQAQSPHARQDSEGLLALLPPATLAGRTAALIGAAGGRGLLRERLAVHAATLREVHVYRRVPPRWDRRHLQPLTRLPRDARVLLSSGEALANLQRALPAPLWRRLRAAVAVVSSARLAQAARAAGFARVTIAASARPTDLLAAAAR
jgi:uroporphyrinogen-III synthase